MNLICYPLLSTRSKRAILKTKKSWGHVYWYNPRGDLLVRLSKQLNLPITKVVEQLEKEREFLLKGLG